MADLGRALQRALLDHALKTASMTVPENIEVRLYTTKPNDEGTGGTEVSGTGYTAIVHNDWNAASNASPSLATNDGAIEFPTPGAGGWGEVNSFGLWGIGTGFTGFMGAGNISPAKTINQDDEVLFPSGDLVVSLD
jgi:hypothetical protein